MGLIKPSLLESLPYKIIPTWRMSSSRFAFVFCALLSIIALILFINSSSKNNFLKPTGSGSSSYFQFPPPISDLPRSFYPKRLEDGASEVGTTGEGRGVASIVAMTHEASSPQSDGIPKNNGLVGTSQSAEFGNFSGFEGQTDKYSEFLGSNGTVSEETQLANLGLEVKNVSLTVKPYSLTEEVSLPAASQVNASASSQEIRPGPTGTEGETKLSVGSAGGLSTQKGVSSVAGKINPILVPHSDTECDYFYGRWVRDDTKPYYRPGSCPFVDKSFNCQANGRPDKGYLKWRWQPHGCDLPSIDAHDFLERMTGKKLVFVGDSLNRNMWESLVCILRDSIKNKTSTYEISGRTDFKKKGFYAIRFEDYDCSIDLVFAPFLVRESLFHGRNGTMETLRLDTMDRTSTYGDADVIVFNTGHWWTHEKTSKGEEYYREGDYVYPRLNVLKAYQKALTTWARWVDEHVNPRRTLVFFRGYSMTHFRGGQWNSGGQCHKEMEPIFNESYLERYPSKMRTLENVLMQMKTPVIYLNVTRLTDYRKDGHPSIYRTTYKTAEQRTTAEQAQDCSHWCLPGVPDAWNDFLYAYIRKHIKR